MRTQKELLSLVREILADGYLTLKVPQYTLHEDLTENVAMIQCRLNEASGGGGHSVTGRGVGMVDALFKGLKSTLSDAYPSLNSLFFVDFSVVGDFTRGEDDHDANSDAPGKITLEVENSSGRRFQFETFSRSVSAGSVDVVVQAVEHFVNSELAVLRVFDWVDDAKRRHRPDLADKYVQILAELVANTSYSETIERRKGDVV